MTKLVENGVGDTGQGQIMKDRESHIKEFSSRFKSGGRWWKILSTGRVGGVVVIWLGVHFNRSPLVCVMKSACACVCFGAAVGKWGSPGHQSVQGRHASYVD